MGFLGSVKPTFGGFQASVAASGEILVTSSGPSGAEGGAEWTRKETIEQNSQKTMNHNAFNGSNKTSIRNIE